MHIICISSRSDSGGTTCALSNDWVNQNGYKRGDQQMHYFSCDAIMKLLLRCKSGATVAVWMWFALSRTECELNCAERQDLRLWLLLLSTTKFRTQKGSSSSQWEIISSNKRLAHMGRTVCVLGWRLFDFSICKWRRGSSESAMKTIAKCLINMVYLLLWIEVSAVEIDTQWHAKISETQHRIWSAIWRWALAIDINNKQTLLVPRKIRQLLSFQSWHLEFLLGEKRLSREQRTICGLGHFCQLNRAEADHYPLLPFNSRERESYDFYHHQVCIDSSHTGQTVPTSTVLSPVHSFPLSSSAVLHFVHSSHSPKY